MKVGGSLEISVAQVKAQLSAEAQAKATAKAEAEEAAKASTEASHPGYRNGMIGNELTEKMVNIL